MLSDVFEEPVDKRNLKSVLKRQSTIKIALNNSNNIDGNKNTINYINACSDIPATTLNNNQSETPHSQANPNQLKIEMVRKLRQFGLSDEQIAEVLGVTLEVLKHRD
jgi:DNA-binding transcriptional regulator YiaG